MTQDYTLQHRSGKSGWKQFFLHNRNAIKRKFKKDLALPWMKQKEIEVLWEIFKNRNPQNSLEWGCGYSTIYFPSLLTGDFKWTSIEHVGEWASIVKKMNARKNVSVEFVAPDDSQAKGEGTYEQYTSYVEAPEKGKPYDFILIDGRARKHCAKKAFDIIKDDGIVVIHDANRQSYLEHTEVFKHQLLFVDYRRTAGGLWIGSKSLPLENIIDVAHHQKAWEVQTKIGRFIRMKFITEGFGKRRTKKGWKPAE